MATHRPGGGIDSKNVRNVRAPKAEPIPHKVTPGAADELGQSLAYRGQPLYSGKGYSPPKGPTDNVAAVGVGGGRTVMRSGSQATHGEVARREGPAPPVRDTLAEFGRDIPGRR
jgi:hypothetical protein